MPSPSPTPRASPFPSRTSSPSPSPSSSSSSSRTGPISGISGPSNSKSTRERFGEHKENAVAVGNGSIRSASHNSKTPPSKKPWNQHFSKNTVAATQRVLGERNSSGSPLRSPSVAKIGAEKVTASVTAPERLAISEMKSPSSTAVFAQKDSLPTARGVANLSKRIQQFFEDQETVLSGVTTPSRSTQTSQASLSSSPYDPYHSPFSERPQFLRLHGTLPSPEHSEFHNNELMVTIPRLHALLARADAAEDSDIEEGEIVGDERMPEQPLLHRDTEEDERLTDSAEKLNVESETVSDEEISKGQQAEGVRCNQMTVTVEVKKESPLKLKDSTDEAFAEIIHNDSIEPQPMAYVADMVLNSKEKRNTVASIVADDRVFGQKEAPRQRHGREEETESCYEEEEELEKGWKYGSEIVYAAVALILLAAVVVACGGPGLLPENLRDNHISSAWRTSRYYGSTQLFLCNMEGLYSPSKTSRAVDISAALHNAMDHYRRMAKLTDQARESIQMHIETTSRSLTVWWMSVRPDKLFHGSEDGIGMDNHGHFDDRKVENAQGGSQANASLISETLAVERTLEDLLSFKGGKTEDDRLEVLEYLWEYTTFSEGIHGYMRNFVPEAQTVLNEDVDETDGASDEAANIDEVGEVAVKEQGETYSCSEKQVEGQIEMADTSSEAGMEEAEQASVGASGYSKEESEELHSYVGDFHSGAMEETDVVYGPMEEAFSVAFTEAVDSSAVEDDGDTQVATNSMDSPTTESKFETSAESAAYDTASEEDRDARKSKHVTVIAIATIGIATVMGFTVAVLRPLDAKASKRRKSKTAMSKASFSTGGNVQFLRREKEVGVEAKKAMLAEEGTWRESGAEVVRTLGGRRNQEEAAMAMASSSTTTTMIEDLNGRFASLLQSPPQAPSMAHSSLFGRVDEDLTVVRSPLSVSSSVQSPYGSFTAYKVVAKKEGTTTEAKLTPVRRSSRIRNNYQNVVESPEPMKAAVRRIAISPA